MRFQNLSPSTDPIVAAFEMRLMDAILAPGLLLVHLWAPWCQDCLSELGPDGWGPLVSAHPDVRFVFVAIWSDGDGRGQLQQHGMESRANLTVLCHPNPSRKKGERADVFLGRPVRWIPAAWVFRDGVLIEAIDHGTKPFAALQRIIGEAPRP